MISSDREFRSGEEHDLSIKAVDNGRPRKSATTRLRITVEDAAPSVGGEKLLGVFVVCQIPTIKLFQA